MHGNNPENLFMTDSGGYTVLEESVPSSVVNQTEYVYATRNDTSGMLISSGIVVGHGNPSEIGIPKYLQPFSDMKDQSQRHLFEEALFTDQFGGEMNYPTSERRRLGNVGPVMKNLVILVRFADHVERILPPRNAYHILFNGAINGNPTHPRAPTGTVKDVFNINSYGKFDLQSTVYGWVTLPKTEGELIRSILTVPRVRL